MGRLKLRWKQFNRSIEMTLGYKPGFIEKLSYLWDFFWAFVFHGCGIIEYFEYDFRHKNFGGRSEYVTLRKFAKLYRHYNNHDFDRFFDDKITFLHTFEKYARREFLDLRECSFEQFDEMFSRLGEIIAKPHSATHGIGVRKMAYSGRQSSLELYEQLKKEECFVEQAVHQIEDIARLNRSSVNTIRINTLIRDNGETVITNASIRIGGAGAVADNLHNNGYGATVDRDTGVVVSKGYDLMMRSAVYHRDSHEQIVGFRIPCWDKVISAALKMSAVIPQMRYVGWDIAIDENGDVVVLEGNSHAGFDLQQIPRGRGIWHRYKW